MTGEVSRVVAFSPDESCWIVFLTPHQWSVDSYTVFLGEVGGDAIARLGVERLENRLDFDNRPSLWMEAGKADLERTLCRGCAHGKISSWGCGQNRTEDTRAPGRQTPGHYSVVVGWAGLG